MGTFFRAIIALIAAIFLGLGALLLVGFGVCALAATTGSMGVFEAGVVVGIIATLAFGIRVFISVFNALGDKPQPNSEENSPTPALPHDAHDQQREQANHDNAD
nr:hypothetical protein [uncultured Kingella sp.]